MANVIRVLFLLLSWDQRQEAKRILTDDEKATLAVALDGEPNW